MATRGLEVADVFRLHGEEFRRANASILRPQHYHVMRAIETCRTAALGGHVDQCDRCGHQVISYNSCRNRHCPKCQALAKAKWLQARRAELLPVQYHHVVFTLPSPLASVCLQNKRVVYNLLFQAASQTLLILGKDPRHLGAQIGFLAILHTWGQNLLHHPHLHCVVPGGGLAPDEEGQWISCRPGFLFPVRVLSRLYRRLFLEMLEQAFERGRLEFHGLLQSLSTPLAFKQLLAKCRRIDWVVYAKPPFAGPQTVLDYLARYTHRIAISNDRILGIQHGRVSFAWKDYRRGGHRRTMTVDAPEFIRRFLLHALPSGFVRIRYYGFLANCHRAKKINACRRLLGQQTPQAVSEDTPRDWADLVEELTGNDPRRCPRCGRGQLVLFQTLSPIRALILARNRAPPAGPPT